MGKQAWIKIFNVAERLLWISMVVFIGNISIDLLVSRPSGNPYSPIEVACLVVLFGLFTWKSKAAAAQIIDIVRLPMLRTQA